MIDVKSKYLLRKNAKQYKKLPILATKLGNIRYHNKKIIAIEGINSSGKTTQVNILKT